MYPNLQHYLTRKSFDCNDLQKICAFLLIFWFSPPIKNNDRYDMTVILLKMHGVWHPLGIMILLLHKRGLSQRVLEMFDISSSFVYTNVCII
jgi:hypothetical protein